MVSVGATAHVDDVVPPVVVVEVEFDVDDGEAGEPVQAPEIAAPTAADNAPMAWRRFIRSSWLLAMGFGLQDCQASAFALRASARPAGAFGEGGRAMGFGLWASATATRASSKTRRARYNTGARFASPPKSLESPTNTSSGQGGRRERAVTCRQRWTPRHCRSAGGEPVPS